MPLAFAFGSARQVEFSAAITVIGVQQDLGTSRGQARLRLGSKAPFLDADAKPGAHGSIIVSAEAGRSKGWEASRSQPWQLRQRNAGKVLRSLDIADLYPARRSREQAERLHVPDIRGRAADGSVCLRNHR